MLYDYVIDPAASQPERGNLWGVSTHSKNKNSPFSGVDECWEAYLSALMDTILGLTAILATLLVLLSVNEAILVRAKNSNGTTVRTFSKFNFLHGHCTLLPFPSALTSLCTPGDSCGGLILNIRWWHQCYVIIVVGVSNNFVSTQVSLITGLDYWTHPNFHKMPFQRMAEQQQCKWG